MKFNDDYNFGVGKEGSIVEVLKLKGYEVEGTHSTAIHDLIFSKDGKRFSGEIKSRRVEKQKYKDTLIGANKLGEAWNKYYREGTETLFFFIYTDGIYYINPFDYIPRRDYLLQRWDRGGFDNKKGWIYFNTDDLILIDNL